MSKKSPVHVKNGGALPIVARFAFYNETPGTWRFAELGDDGMQADKEAAKIGSIYIRKSALKTRPDTITITIVEGDK